MKKFLSLLLVALLLVSFSTSAMAANREARQPDVFVNDTLVEFADQNAYITDEGRTLVPARGVFEAMDCKVDWDSENYVVTVTNESQKKEITLTIDDTEMKVVTDGKETVKTLDVPATLMNNRTMVPLRAISEALGCMVLWNGAEYSVCISYTKQITAEEFSQILQNIFNGSGDKEEKPLVNEKDKQPVIVETEGKIILDTPKNAVKAGDKISVVLSIENNPGIAAMLLTADYNKDVLSLTNVIHGDVFDEGIYNTEQSMMFWVSAANVTENGKLAILEFTVNENAVVGEYPVTVVYDQYEDVINDQLDSLGIDIVGGKITVK